MSNPQKATTCTCPCQLQVPINFFLSVSQRSPGHSGAHRRSIAEVPRRDMSIDKSMDKSIANLL